MVEQIAENMSKGQVREIKNLLESTASAFDVMGLKFSLEEAQGIITNGGAVKDDLNFAINEVLKKYGVVDKRFGPALKEFDLTVPVDYVHEKQIDKFGRKTKKLKTTYYFNDDLTSKNFAKATNKLEAEKTYTVKIFPILKRVTSEDCMTFLRKENAIFVGGQGLTLAQELSADEFPVNKWTVSFDEKDALWEDSDGNHGVPGAGRGSGGDWRFNLGDFGGGWGGDGCLLCFCDKK